MSKNRKINKLFYLVLIGLCLFGQSFAWNIKRITSIRQAEKVLALAHENVLVVFDIDDTLLMRKNSESKDEPPVFGPVENCMIEAIQKLQERDVPVIALTASIFGPWRVDDLSQVQLDFSNSFGCKKYIFKALPEDPDFRPSFYHGVLCSGACNKGELLELFITRCCPFRVSRVIFFDDQLPNCHDVCDKMSRSGIPITCYHYCAPSVQS